MGRRTWIRCTEEYLIQPNSPKFDPLTQYAVQATTTSNIACYAVLRALHGSSKWVNYIRVIIHFRVTPFSNSALWRANPQCAPASELHSGSRNTQKAVWVNTMRHPKGSTVARFFLLFIQIFWKEAVIKLNEKRDNFRNNEAFLLGTNFGICNCCDSSIVYAC